MMCIWLRLNICEGIGRHATTQGILIVSEVKERGIRFALSKDTPFSIQSMRGIYMMHALYIGRSGQLCYSRWDSRSE